MFLQMLENMGKILIIPHPKKKQIRKYYDMFSNFLKVCLYVYIHIHKKNLQRYTNIIVGFLSVEFSKVFLSFLTHNS